jgi:hypothetical protein
LNTEFCLGSGLSYHNPRIEDTDTDTDTETETEPELEVQPPKPNVPHIRNTLSNLTNLPSDSPSPLPSAHASINRSLDSIPDLPVNRYPQTLGSSQHLTQSQTASTRHALQPLFRQSSSSTNVRSISRPQSAASSISLGQPIYHSRSSTQRSNPTQSLPPASNPAAASADDSGPHAAPSSRRRTQPRASAGSSHPRGTAEQESSRSHRAANKRADSRRMALARLPATTRRSINFAHTQRIQHGVSSSTNLQLNRPSPPELMEDDEEERERWKALIRGQEAVCKIILIC